MKILVLNGSPRPNGDTSALTAQFKKGAEDAGNTVTEFQLSKMKIGGCLGKVLSGWVTQPGDIAGKPELAQAYELGRSVS